MARLSAIQIELKYSSKTRIGMLIAKGLNKILPLEISVKKA